jgi:hypothetical protein
MHGKRKLDCICSPDSVCVWVVHKSFDLNIIVFLLRGVCRVDGKGVLKLAQETACLRWLEHVGFCRELENLNSSDKVRDSYLVKSHNIAGGSVNE